MARSHRARNNLALGLLMLGLAAMQPALAKQDDRNQIIHVTSKSFDGAQQPNSTSTLTGNVVVIQGTLKANSDKARIHFDADSQIDRIILDGAPAKIQQMGDDGNMMYGHASNIDYANEKGIATLTGDAYVQQQTKGDAHGDHLVYNTNDSTMQGTSNGDNQVVMTFQPKVKPVTAPATPAKPAAAGTPAPATSAPAPATSPEKKP
ncbi:MAG TPA: lipopolysaccharide transport periplasmic protein LptA [Luteibacter sp.]|nr:lipopolysaccharide transport periplasmic protein LptA [Luteibacter sp.]